MAGKTLYLECNAGISGDMMVASMLDLGADEAVLKKVLKSVPVDGFNVEISRVKKAGLEACDFNVVLDRHHENYDHDMDYLHGDENYIKSDKKTMEDNDEHSHNHKHHNRGLLDIKEIILKTQMTQNAKNLAMRIFDILADAEAKAHGVSKMDVHFHEIGAVDSIVDIIAAAVCIDNLKISECIVPVLYEGCGSVRCQHGVLPIPVPAVVNIIAANQMNLSIMQMNGEFVTPTGAAIAAAIKTSDKLPKKFIIEKIGLGAGKRNYEKPSILRAMLILNTENTDDEAEDEIWKLESDIDDSTGEELGFCMEKLFAAGAKDVHYFPVFMKKNRPAYQINVICDKKDITKMESIIFKETTTIGIRRIKMERTIQKRNVVSVYTDIGEAQVKVCEYDNETYIYPEYESVKKLCLKSGLSYRQVYNRIVEGLED